MPHCKFLFIYRHIGHDCTFGNSQCKCSIMAGVPVKRRESKYIRHSSQLGERFWRAAAKYYFLGEERGAGRCYIYLANGGMYNMVNPPNAQLAGRKEDIKREDTEGCLDCPNTNAQALHWTENSQAVTCSSADDSCSSGTLESKNECSCIDQSRHEKTCTMAILKILTGGERKIMWFLFQNLITPPDACLKLRLFLEHIRISEEDRVFKDIIQIYNRWVRPLTLQQFIALYEGKNKVYTALDSDFGDTYWDLEESLNKLEFFLLKQFHNGESSVGFMETLFKNQTRMGGKKGNTIWIKGPADCGKSWFVDSLKSLQGTFGICSILNKNNNFATAGLVDKRLIVLDEFNFDPLVYSDTVKALMSGNVFATPQKFKSDGAVLKTPVIMISNGECIPDNEIFKSRHIRVDWSKIDTNNYTPRRTNISDKPEKIMVNGIKMKLVHNFYVKLLHPMAFVEYWKKYNIWNTSTDESVYVVDYTD